MAHPQSWAVNEIKRLLDSQQDPDLLPCGPEILQHFFTLAQSFCDDGGWVASSESDVGRFLNLAYTNMSSMPQDNSLCWRRLYTDASILQALANLSDLTSLTEAVALESVATLDRAIIIAGAPGIARLEWIFHLIQRIQTQYLNSTSPLASNKHFSPTSYYGSIGPGTFEASVECIDPPSFTSFQRLSSRKPFILRGYVLDWPAMKENPWSSEEYLRSIAGPGRVVPVEVGTDYRLDNWRPDITTWDSFLSTLHPVGSGSDITYLAQHNLLTQFPALRDDIILPDYVYMSPPAPPSYPEYSPPQNEDQLVLNAWLGPRGTISPAHTDPFYNCYAQVVGRKTVWLAPPDVTPFMYPFPAVLSNVVDKSHNPAANTTNPCLSNTSRVDVFPSSAEAKHTSLIEFPLFWENVPKYALCTTLEPGDLLFFPPGWWHAMRSEDVSFSISMWF